MPYPPMHSSRSAFADFVVRHPIGANGPPLSFSDLSFSALLSSALSFSADGTVAAVLAHRSAS
jgi:hypothetical protein